MKIGFGSGIIELGAVVIAMLLSKQIMRYCTATELAVYGVLVTIFQLFSVVVIRTYFVCIGRAYRVQPSSSKLV